MLVTKVQQQPTDNKGAMSVHVQLRSQAQEYKDLVIKSIHWRYPIKTEFVSMNQLHFSKNKVHLYKHTKCDTSAYYLFVTVNINM